MTGTGLASSFRDPSGFLFEDDGVLYRQIDASFRDQHELLHSSGLYDALVEQRLLIPHEDAALDLAPAPGAYKVIKPQLVEFISYPYEWSPGQLVAAARATLRIQKLAMKHGMSLRDASAFNIQFVGGYPTLIDTLSFEALVEGRPWVAYRQFCQHFVAPLALIKHVDVRLGRLSRVHIDGVPLDLASHILPARTRAKPGILTHVHAHAASQRRNADGDQRGAKGREATVSRRSLEGLIANLDATVEGLRWTPGSSTWGDYYAGGHNYTDGALDHKHQLVGEHVDAVEPESVWDLGANTGRFSRIASERGIPTVAFDFDEAAVEANWRRVIAEDEASILPLIMDLTNPSASLGWAGRERDSLAERGPADLALALALVHHLAIGNNVPLDRIASWFATLCHHLTVEFVPKSDSKVKTLLASREDIFDDYTSEGFEAAFAPYFDIVRSDRVAGSERTLYLMRRR